MKVFGTALTQPLLTPALKFQECLSERCLLLFGQPLPDGGAGALGGFGNCKIALRRQGTAHSRECDTSAASAEEPWPCLRLFSLPPAPLFFFFLSAFNILSSPPFLLMCHSWKCTDTFVNTSTDKSFCSSVT